jgi:integrase
MRNRRRDEPDGAARFEIGGYYLDRPHPDRGGYWYACRYDARTGDVSRRSLKETDFERAKLRLAALIATAPQITREGPPDPSCVLTLAVLQAYMDGRGAAIASEDVATRAVFLITTFLDSIKRIDAPVSFWTPAQQLEFAKWCRENYQHSAGTIARHINVMRSAFIDASRFKIRLDALGNRVEAALILTSPKIVMRRELVAAELKIPQKRPRNATLSLDQMATVIDALDTPHLLRFAVLSLATWARPQAVIDFDPDRQTDWADGTIDLAPPDWVQTNKRRPRQPMTRCLEGWLDGWAEQDRARRDADAAAGRPPVESGLLIYKRRRVACVKKAFRRIGRDVGLTGFSQYAFRHFMADQTKKLFRGVAREQRSLWLGHVVRDGSRTTEHYESDDPQVLADVALATDCIITLLNERCQKQLFAVETLLNRKELQAIGARELPKKLGKPGGNGGRDRDRTCDPLHVKEVLFR